MSDITKMPQYLAMVERAEQAERERDKTEAKLDKTAELLRGTLPMIDRTGPANLDHMKIELKQVVLGLLGMMRWKQCMLSECPFPPFFLASTSLQCSQVHSQLDSLVLPSLLRLFLPRDRDPAYQ